MKPLKIHTQTGICEIVADESVKNLKNQLRDERYVIIIQESYKKGVYFFRKFFGDLEEAKRFFDRLRKNIQKD